MLKKTTNWNCNSRFSRDQTHHVTNDKFLFSDHHVIFQGEATDGGFAIDDVTFYNGTCATRPMEAAVKAKTEES